MALFLRVGPQEAVGMTEGEELTHGIRRHCGRQGQMVEAEGEDSEGELA